MRSVLSFLIIMTLSSAAFCKLYIKVGVQIKGDSIKDSINQSKSEIEQLFDYPAIEITSVEDLTDKDEFPLYNGASLYLRYSQSIGLNYQNGFKMVTYLNQKTIDDLIKSDATTTLYQRVDSTAGADLNNSVPSDTVADMDLFVISKDKHYAISLLEISETSSLALPIAKQIEGFQQDLTIMQQLLDEAKAYYKKHIASSAEEIQQRQAEKALREK